MSCFQLQRRKSARPKACGRREEGFFWLYAQVNSKLLATFAFLMPEYTTLLTQVDGTVMTVTINRPEALNAISGAVMTELGNLFSEVIPEMKELRGVIITGAGERSFVAGADIKEFLVLTGSEGREMSERGQRIFKSIERCNVPVVAAIQGFALGAGCELAMACHMRVAGEKAKFGQPEVNLGLVPGYGGTQRLVELIGKTKAMEYLLTAEMISADDALRLRLVNYVVPAGQELEKARELINKTVTKAPIALAGIIESVNAFNDPSMDGYSAEVHNFGRCANTEDFREGASAFIEKRPAHFQGR